MDNPAMAHLIPNTLLHKKDILFGNMPEIYQFHKKWVNPLCLCGVIKLKHFLFCLFTLCVFQDFSSWTGGVHRLSWACGTVFLGESESDVTSCAVLIEYIIE